MSEEKIDYRIELDCSKEPVRELLNKITSGKISDNKDIQQIIIRNITEKDEEDFLEMFEGIRNNPKNMPFFACKTQEDTKAYFKRIISGEEGKRVIVPALSIIDSKGEEKCIGILPIDRYGNGDIGYALNPQYQGRGILKLVLPLMINYMGFCDREILDASAHPDNKPSNHRLENTNFEYTALTATRYVDQDGYVEPRNNYILTKQAFLELFKQNPELQTTINTAKFYINGIKQTKKTQLFTEQTEEKINQSIITTIKDLLDKQLVGICRICGNLSQKIDQLHLQSERLDLIKKRLNSMKLISKEIENKLMDQKEKMVIENIDLTSIKEKSSILLTKEMENILQQINLDDLKEIEKKLQTIKETVNTKKEQALTNDEDIRGELKSNDKLQESLFNIQHLIKEIDPTICKMQLKK